jgi:hypothetical protein
MQCFIISELVISLDEYTVMRSESSVANGYIRSESIRILPSVALIVSGTCRIRQIEGESLNILRALICAAVVIEILGMF